MLTPWLQSTSYGRINVSTLVSHPPGRGELCCWPEQSENPERCGRRPSLPVRDGSCGHRRPTAIPPAGGEAVECWRRSLLTVVQGDPSMYEPEIMVRRLALMRDPNIVKAVNTFWYTFQKTTGQEALPLAMLCAALIGLWRRQLHSLQ